MLAVRKLFQAAAQQVMRHQAVHRTAIALNKKEFEVTFVRESGERITTKGKVGDSLFDVIVNNDIDIDGFGACEGTLACSTCHLIFKPEDYAKLREKPTDEEMDMLDLAFGLTETSRLGCQVFLTENESGMEIQLPAGVNDQRAA
ncbi:adrenodoxin-like [Tropilaelaps mercedesae]|uniref:Adrenodoxin-like n=1 Tax=Tropilaelaps mercedesae TaxID=418985 RepID=A0A1V9Y1Q9_9ACAR|nr:adrenodoxin-like [Tropilaelaps mercedesae]